MVNRRLFLAGYDVTDPNRLRRAHRILRAYATGGQKSVFECFLTDRERKTLLRDVAAVIDPDEDRFFIVRLDKRARVYTFGVGRPPVDFPIFFVT